MFKTSEEIIVIQAEATTAIPTGVVFWSHDKGTAKLIIQLKKDHINQTLPQGTIVPILLEFNSDTAAKGKGRHIYHAVIENALEGIVSIVLEDNILGYVGRVDGSVYIELPDSRSLDTAGRFTFDIKRSPIDEDVPELEDYYWQGFNEIIQESKRLIDQVESNCKTVLNDLSSKVTSLENQTSDIKSKQAEILKSIEEHDVFTKQESSANVIYQVIGKEKAEITFRLDAKSEFV
ncbi:BppU family phage baseplate upper protein, partial [Enterococcus sp. HMSC072H05]|uniref:BppU family phage baseplate upper protein n=1 Tax=Enterococcus sp. HMSC072H05 TaxID=1715012 RepID=UPI0035684AC6